MTLEEILALLCPPPARVRSGVDSFLVLSAMSYQPSANSYPPSTIILVPRVTRRVMNLLLLLFLSFFQGDEEIGFTAVNQNQQGFALLARF